MRTVEFLRFDAETSIPAGKLEAAAGYLAMWNLDLAHVRIVFDAEQGELLASYRAEHPTKVYVRGFAMLAPRPDCVNSATWHEDSGEFSFQS